MMSVLKLVLLVFLRSISMQDNSCGVANRSNASGVWVNTESFDARPWHVAVLNSSYEYLACGSIISAWFVLTVAHVTYTDGTVPKLPNELITMGTLGVSSDESIPWTFNVSRIIRYDGYKQNLGIDDLALLKTTRTIRFFTSPVCLWPTQNLYDFENRTNQISIVSWSEKEEMLKLFETHLTENRLERFLKHSGELIIKHESLTNVNKTVLCMNNGDGVVYIKHQHAWQLVGIITHKEHNKKLDKACAYLEDFQIMDMAYYKKWIEKHVFQTQHNLLGLEECGTGLFEDAGKYGEPIVPQHQPWIAQLVYQFWGRFNVTDCHGVLIHPEFVITTSRCTVNRRYRKLLHVILGAYRIGKDRYSTNKNEVQAIEVLKNIFPDNFDTFKPNFDINVLRLAKKADITDIVKPVCLPPVVEPVPYYTMVAWNRGGGHPKELQSSTMRVVPFDKCQSTYLKKGISLDTESFSACYESCQISTVQHGSQSCKATTLKPCNVPIPGGPLFYTKHDGFHSYTYLAGIKSFGSASCLNTIYDVFNDIVSFRSDLKRLVHLQAWYDENLNVYDFEEIEIVEDFEDAIRLDFEDDDLDDLYGSS